jgi:hypothetical protein
VVAAGLLLFRDALFHVHGAGVETLGGHEIPGDGAGGIVAQVGARAVLGNDVLKAQRAPGFGVHRHQQLFLIERAVIARDPVLDGAIAVEARGGAGDRFVFQEKLGRQAVGIVPMHVGRGDGAEAHGIELLRPQEAIGGRAGLLAGELVGR